jgi:hypothetical protein
MVGFRSSGACAMLIAMLTLHCKLSLSDGRLVEGKVEARSPGVEYHLLYTGSVDLLSLRPSRGTPADLELIFRMASYRKDANLLVERQGDYDLKSNEQAI